MINWIDNLDGWDGSLPVVLAAAGLSLQQRDATFQRIVARGLDVPPEAVVIERATGRAPAVARPRGTGLHLSTSSRGPFRALAAAGSRIGVDVELADAGEIPWNVLHPDEVSWLARENDAARAQSFARLWSVKEAYLKALGIGLAREPASFAVRCIGADAAAVDDSSAPLASVDVRTVWRETAGLRAAVSAVLIEGPTRSR